MYDKEKHRIAQHKWEKRNPNYRRKWESEHKKERSEYIKEWRSKNKEQYDSYQKEWREDNKEYIKKHQEQYCQDNKEWINRQRKERRQRRRTEYITNKSCPYCGESNLNKLLLHHLFQKDSTLEGRGNSDIWIWEKSRRIFELLKCLVVCRSCHRKIHTGKI